MTEHDLGVADVAIGELAAPDHLIGIVGLTNQAPRRTAEIWTHVGTDVSRIHLGEFLPGAGRRWLGIGLVPDDVAIGSTHGKTVEVDRTTIGCPVVVGRSFGHHEAFGVACAIVIIANLEEIVEHVAVGLVVGDAHEACARTGSIGTHAKALCHERMSSHHLAGSLDGLRIVGLVASLDTLCKISLGEVVVGNALGSTAVLLGILGQTSLGSHEVLDGEGVGLLTGGTSIVELQFFAVLSHDGHTTEALAQTEIGPTQEELRLSNSIFLLSRILPLDELGTMQSQVGVGCELIELVPKAVEVLGIGVETHIVGEHSGCHVGIGLATVDHIGATTAQKVACSHSLDIHVVPAIHIVEGNVFASHSCIDLTTLGECRLYGVDGFWIFLKEIVVVARYHCTCSHHEGEKIIICFHIVCRFLES